MGCDIHFFVEYKTENEWNFFAEIRISRNYSFFAVLAGVRNYWGKGINFIEPRGLLKDITLDVIDKYTLLVVNENTDISGYCTKEQANKYEEDSQKYYNKSLWWNKEKTKIVHPDWHTASWLSLKEFKLAYLQYLSFFKEEDFTELEKIRNLKELTVEEKKIKFLQWSEKGIKYVSMPKILLIDAIISAMETLGESRVVFWFDN